MQKNEHYIISKEILIKKIDNLLNFINEKERIIDININDVKTSNIIDCKYS